MQLWDDDDGRMRLGTDAPVNEYMVGRFYEGSSALDREDLAQEIIAMAATLVDLDEQTGQRPIGIASCSGDGPLDVALPAGAVPSGVRLDPPALLASLLDVSSHGCLLGLLGRRSAKRSAKSGEKSHRTRSQPPDQGISARSDGLEPPTF